MAVVAIHFPSARRTYKTQLTQRARSQAASSSVLVNCRSCTKRPITRELRCMSLLFKWVPKSTLYRKRFW